MNPRWKFFELKVRDEESTIRRIINKKVSISRYGDGELKLCIGKNQICQKHNLGIQKALREILTADTPNLIVGIPRSFDKDLPWMPEDKEKHWRRFSMRPDFARLYRREKVYYSAFITRPDSAPHIDCPEYWNFCKQIWKDRYVVVLQGWEKGFGDSDFLDGAERLDILYGPKQEAFAERGRLMKKLLSFPEEALFILSLGPTATVLASDLCKKGRQALDLGHLAMFYTRRLPKQKGYDKNPDK